MKKYDLLLFAIVFILFLNSCAPEKNPSVGTIMSDGTVAGFWKGVWHGIIAPLAFIVSLFNKSVNIYEVHNNGVWYNLGFLLGIGGESGLMFKRR